MSFGFQWACFCRCSLEAKTVYTAVYTSQTSSTGSDLEDEELLQEIKNDARRGRSGGSSGTVGFGLRRSGQVGRSYPKSSKLQMLSLRSLALAQSRKTPGFKVKEAHVFPLIDRHVKEAINSNIPVQTYLLYLH